jgi:hypothetical protein
MPLDEKVKQARYVTTRAVTVCARPVEIWPWVVQMGELPRGGFYSYDWIENLMGMHIKSADRILPEFQQLETGAVLVKDGGIVVKAVEAEHYLALGPPENLPSWDNTWVLALYPAGPNDTRLVSRVRARLRPTLKNILFMLILDPGQFIMERKMLLGIKKRAEDLARKKAEERELVPNNRERRLEELEIRPTKVWRWV